MNHLKNILTVILFFTIYSTTYGQAELLDSLPETKEDIIRSEKKVLATIDWLENTPVNEDVDKRKTQYALFMAWVVNSPTVTVEVNADIVNFADKNGDLLIIFMAGWTKYCLENNYSKDLVRGNVAGIRSAIKFYKKNDTLNKDKAMQKLIDIDAKGGLEEWVTKQLAKK